MPNGSDRRPGPFPPKPLNIARASAKFAEFWKGPITCPICKTDEWHFGPDLVHLSHLTAINEESPTAYPSVVVICDNCGYTLLFNARRLGLDNG
jgi:hypothetical protein